MVKIRRDYVWQVVLGMARLPKAKIISVCQLVQLSQSATLQKM